jgi:hypothetical protein
MVLNMTNILRIVDLDGKVTDRPFTELEQSDLENLIQLASDKQAQAEAKAMAKASALAKLAALGLSADEIAAL